VKFFVSICNLKVFEGASWWFAEYHVRADREAKFSCHLMMYQEPCMSFTETLFGGLIAVVILYFVARRAGLPNFWSALLSGGVPFLAYLVYCLKYGFHGDVLTIHLVVYWATAERTEIQEQNALGAQGADVVFRDTGDFDGVVFIHLHAWFAGVGFGMANAEYGPSCDPYRLFWRDTQQP
jgi:hypothetical protein